MLINAKLNDTDQKMIWTEALHMCKRTRKIMDTTGSKKIPFENIHGEKPKIIGLLSEFRRIGYVKKFDKLKTQMT